MHRGDGEVSFLQITAKTAVYYNQSLNKGSCAPGWRQLLHRKKKAENIVYAYLHFFSKPVNLPLSITEYDSLCYCQRIVEVTQRVKFPLFSLHSNKELFNTFQSQFITVNNNSYFSDYKKGLTSSTTKT